jgi:N-acetylglutamate synthase-like GNAT family acetyltransferase
VVTSDFTLRQATEADLPAIRGLIRRVRINPMSLDWRRFIIAVDVSDQLLGCGQLKPHGKDILELASIAVQPGHRGQGIARAIIERLLVNSPRPLYLICRAPLGRFYEKWGFRALSVHEMPRYFRRLAQLAGVFSPLTGPDNGMLVMKLM